jgi:hypothetical protein
MQVMNRSLRDFTQDEAKTLQTLLQRLANNVAA